jgi:hypothetical protein
LQKIAVNGTVDKSDGPLIERRESSLALVHMHSAGDRNRHCIDVLGGVFACASTQIVLVWWADLMGGKSILRRGQSRKLFAWLPNRLDTVIDHSRSTL